MKTTPFYEAAINFETGNTHLHGCCDELDRITDKDKSVKRFFEKNFKPRRREWVLYNANFLYWLQGNHQLSCEVQQDRIIALLFADLMWRDEHE